MAEPQTKALNKCIANVTYEEYNGPQKPALVRDLNLYKDLVTVLPCGTRMPGAYKLYHDQYQAFRCRGTDVWVASFPKAGTTWTQELVWCILFGLDHPHIGHYLTKRFPFFEWDSLFPPEYSMDDLLDDDPNKRGVMWATLTTTLPSPRTIKTHMHAALLPDTVGKDGGKIIYVSRDPRDLCVSLYFHSLLLDGYQGDFEAFVQLFLDDALPWAPYWSNVLSYWNRRHEPNVLFLRYEELSADLPTALRRVASFLAVSRDGQAVGDLPPEEVAALADHLSFASMKNNKATNNDMFATAAVASEKSKDLNFMRKGKVGDHKNHLTADHVKQFQAWTKRWVEGTDFPHYQQYQ